MLKRLALVGLMVATLTSYVVVKEVSSPLVMTMIETVTMLVE